MRITRGYRTELNLNNEQITLCKKHAGAARFAYNWGLRRKQEVYKATGRSISARELHRELNQLKQTELPWMYEVSKCCGQEALRDLDNAFKHFFRRCRLKKEGKWKGKPGYPRFKTKRKGPGSFRLTGAIHVREDAVKLPRLDWLRLKEHSYIPIDGVHILSATVSEQAGRWFVSIQVQEEIPDPTPARAEPLGVDLGIKSLAVCSDGTAIENPKALRSNLKRLKRLHRRLSRRTRGGKNREKARAQLARQYARVANIRRDALHKATSLITAKTKHESKKAKRQQQRPKKVVRERPGIIVLEDLNVEGMKRNHNLALSICDAGLGEFRRQIAYKTIWQGEALLVADRFYPSTKQCSQCQRVKDEMDLSERVYICEHPECGLVIDRDLNAARNLAALAR
jgi:putative transposase